MGALDDKINMMKADFKKARDSVLLKGSALDSIEQIAINTAEEIIKDAAEKEANLTRHIESLKVSIKAHQHKTEQALAEKEHHIAGLEQKLKDVIQSGNEARKQAAARGNRYKARFEHLLDDMDALLPGAKELLTSKVLSRHEKAQQLAKLNNQIRQQKKRVTASITPLANQYGETPLMKRQRSMLQALLVKRDKLKTIKSY